MIEVNNRVITIKPNQEFDSNVLLYNKYLTELTPKPQPEVVEKKEVKKFAKQQKLEGSLNDS